MVKSMINLRALKLQKLQDKKLEVSRASKGSAPKSTATTKQDPHRVKGEYAEIPEYGLLELFSSADAVKSTSKSAPSSSNSKSLKSNTSVAISNASSSNLNSEWSGKKGRFDNTKADDSGWKQNIDFNKVLTVQNSSQKSSSVTLNAGKKNNLASSSSSTSQKLQKETKINKNTKNTNKKQEFDDIDVPNLAIFFESNDDLTSKKVSTTSKKPASTKQDVYEVALRTTSQIRSVASKNMNGSRLNKINQNNLVQKTFSSKNVANSMIEGSRISRILHEFKNFSSTGVFAQKSSGLAGTNQQRSISSKISSFKIASKVRDRALNHRLSDEVIQPHEAREGRNTSFDNFRGLSGRYGSKEELQYVLRSKILSSRGNAQYRALNQFIFAMIQGGISNSPMITTKNQLSGKIGNAKSRSLFTDYTTPISATWGIENGFSSFNNPINQLSSFIQLTNPTASAKGLNSGSSPMEQFAFLLGSFVGNSNPFYSMIRQSNAISSTILRNSGSFEFIHNGIGISSKCAGSKYVVSASDWKNSMSSFIWGFKDTIEMIRMGNSNKSPWVWLLKHVDPPP